MIFPKHVVLLDLETTGLNPKEHQIICIGLTYRDQENIVHTDHWFLEEPDEEVYLLQRLLLFLADYEAIFTYYGRGFEFPFIKARLAHYGLDDSLFLKLKLIDMKLPLKTFGTKRLELEKLFDFKRHFQSSGQDIVKLYCTYVQTKDNIYKTCITSHQQEELISLTLFFELYITLYDTKEWTLIKQQNNESHLVLSIQSPSSFTTNFKGDFENISIAYHKDDNFFTLTLPLFVGKLAHDLKPLKDYYYIDSQKELIHKSLAQFMPKNLLRKATKTECVVYKESTFLPILSAYKVSLPLWHAEDKDSLLYLELKDFSLNVLESQIFTFFFSNQKR